MPEIKGANLAEQRRAAEIFNETRGRVLMRTDRMFAGLMVLQWAASVIAALVISPSAWTGEYGEIHIHVWTAIFLGGAITLVPVALALQYPGRVLTRHVIAVGQMLMSALLIHLTGGRIETHFHVFGSLALLALYRDWRVLISASVVVVADHFARGLYWPQSIYGVAAVEPWRWLEHAGWLVFEDVCLTIAVLQSVKDMMGTAAQQAGHERSELTLRKVFEVCPDTICITTIDGRYIDANPRLACSGYTLTELKQGPPDLSMIWVNPSQLVEFGDRLRKSGSVEKMEVTFRGKDGATAPNLISGSIIELYGEPCVVTFISDISALKRTETELVAAREAALTASRTKSEFLSSMSHEIRTPMNAILGMADLLAETQLTPEQQKFVSTMTSNGNALLTLLNGILDLARIESGRLNLEQAEFELEELVHDVAETMAVRAHEKNLELTVRIGGALPARVIGDPLRLRQVLINLVGNAIKFTDSGEVAVSVENGPAPPGEVRLSFSVRDTGIGIPADKLDLVFQSFTQADSSATRKYGGTGLGLTIASRLVELMAGRLNVTSEVGKGSTFHFVASLNLAAQSAEIEQALNLAGVRVLVVDDNATNRLILTEMLKSLDADLSEAGSGPAAVEQSKRAIEDGRPFRLVLLDCRMPAMDGFEVATRLRSQAGGPPPIILMLSSEDLARTLESVQGAGIELYLVKPVRRTELARAIARALGVAAHEQAKSAPKENGAANDASQLSARPLKILLAEDSPDNRNLIVAYLKSYPYQLEHAENGAVAVAKFVKGGYDLVLMDMQMPVLDGYAAARAIRKWEHEQPRTPTPIAALTASALEEDVRRTIEAGCTAHISKPIKKSRLLAAIAELTRAPASTAAGHDIKDAIEAPPDRCALTGGSGSHA